MTRLDVRELVAGYEPGLPIVRGADLTLAAGEIVVLLGPNGAGKSTLAKAVAGLVRVEAGDDHARRRLAAGRAGASRASATASPSCRRRRTCSPR